MIDLLLLPYELYGNDMLGIILFHFCQLWAVKGWFIDKAQTYDSP